MSIVLVPGDVPRIRIHPRIEGLTVRIQTLLRHLERRFVRALLHVERGFYEVDEALVRRRQRFVFEIPEQVGAARDQVAGVGLDDVAALLDEKRRQLVLCGARRAGFDAPGERTGARTVVRLALGVDIGAGREEEAGYIDRAGRGTARHVVQRDAFARQFSAIGDQGPHEPERDEHASRVVLAIQHPFVAVRGRVRVALVRADDVPPREGPSGRLARRQGALVYNVPIPRPEFVLRLSHRHPDASEPRPLGRVRALAQGRPLGRELAHRDDDGRRDRVRRDLAEQVRRQAQERRFFPARAAPRSHLVGHFVFCVPRGGVQSRPRMLVRWLAPVSPGLLCASAGRAS